MPLILAAIATLACGRAPTAPGPITTPTPKGSVALDASGWPVWPPPFQDGVSLAAVQVVAVTVPPPTLLPPPIPDPFSYLPTFLLRETGGAYGATIGPIQFIRDDGIPLETIRNPPQRIEAGSHWEFQNRYFDIDEPQPLTGLVVRVNFLGDDRKLGAAEGTWTASPTPQP
jgi:hypothetical protein